MTIKNINAAILKDSLNLSCSNLVEDLINWLIIHDDSIDVCATVPEYTFALLT